MDALKLVENHSLKTNLKHYFLRDAVRNHFFERISSEDIIADVLTKDLSKFSYRHYLHESWPSLAHLPRN